MLPHELPYDNNHDRSSLEIDRRLALPGFIQDVGEVIENINIKIGTTDDEFLIAQLSARREQVISLTQIIADAITNNGRASFDPNEAMCTNPNNIYPYGQSSGEKSPSLEASTLVGFASGTDDVLSALVPDDAFKDYFTHCPLSQYDDLPGSFDKDNNLTLLSWTSIPGVSVSLRFPFGDTPPEETFPDLKMVIIEQLNTA